MELPAGARVGPYEVVGPLGAGGMGEVYRARDPRLGRDVALKVLPAHVGADPERLRRFEQEARAAGLLNHPNILTVHDVGTADGHPYLVCELLEGETLRERLHAGALPPARAIDIGDPGGPRARGRPRQGGRAPRPQAREPVPHGRRPREDPRLRDRQVARVGDGRARRARDRAGHSDRAS